MKPLNILALLLLLISLACLYPGLVKPILSIRVGAEIPLLGRINLHNSTQSIMNTIQTLHKNNNTLVAGLILLFSVIVPVLKAVLLLIALGFRKMKGREKLHKFVSIISKWSMADVFVVGVLLAFLATKSDENINATLHDGFYYFLAYCILSILATQLISINKVPDSA